MNADAPCHSAMPPPAPLEMRPQDLRAAPARRPDVPAPKRSAVWRIAVFSPALLGTALLVYGLYGWLAGAGMTGLEWALLSMIGAVAERQPERSVSLFYGTRNRSEQAMRNYLDDLAEKHENLRIVFW